MISKEFILMTLLCATLLNVSTAMVECAADWPSESLEKCPFEGEEFRPESFGSRVARTTLQSRTTVRFVEIDRNIDEELPEENNATSILASGSESEDAEDHVSYTKRDPTEEPVPTKGSAPPTEPAWPNKWTKKPCCQLSCACYKYLSGIPGEKPKRMSEAWKKARCCYQQILDDPNCSNPPPFERLGFVQPPWCLS